MFYLFLNKKFYISHFTGFGKLLWMLRVQLSKVFESQNRQRPRSKNYNINLEQCCVIIQYNNYYLI